MRRPFLNFGFRTENQTVPKKAGARAIGQLSCRYIWQLNVTLDHMMEISARRRQNRAHAQRSAGEVLFANNTFDLLLRGHANVFQEFTKRHVKAFIFHFILHVSHRKSVPLRVLVYGRDPDMIRYDT